MITVITLFRDGSILLYDAISGSWDRGLESWRGSNRGSIERNDWPTARDMFLVRVRDGAIGIVLTEFGIPISVRNYFESFIGGAIGTNDNRYRNTA